MKCLRAWLSQFDWGALIGAALCLAFYLGVAGPIVINWSVLTGPSQQHQTENAKDSKKNPHIPAAQGGDEALATYTLWLVVFTAILAVSTIGLWLVTAKTLSHAKDDAARQADDSRRQRAHLIESNMSARRASQASVRAANAAMLNAQAFIAAETAHIKAASIELRLSSRGVGFFGIGGPQTPPTPLEIFKDGQTDIQFRNTGRTEGDLIAVSVNYFAGSALPVIPAYAEPEKIAPGRSIAANGGAYLWTDYRRPKPTDEEIEIAEAIFSGGYWIYGYFVFLDYMNHRQRVRFCYKLGSSGLLGGIGSYLYPYGPDAYFGQEPEPSQT